MLEPAFGWEVKQGKFKEREKKKKKSRLGVRPHPQSEIVKKPRGAKSR